MMTQTLGDPCSCAECRQAGVDTLPSVINTKTGESLHGYPLKRWIEARDKFMVEYRRASAPRPEGIS